MLNFYWKVGERGNLSMTPLKENICVYPDEQNQSIYKSIKDTIYQSCFQKGNIKFVKFFG